MNEIHNHILTNFGDIVYSCLIPHDIHWEHRMPDHGVVFVRSGKLRIEARSQIIEIPAGQYVFLRRDCTVNITKMPVDETPYTGINISLARKSLKEFYSTMTPTRPPIEIKALAETAYRLPATAAIEGLFHSLIPYVDRGECPSHQFLVLKMHEAIECLLDTDRRLYATLFDFNEPWKIDILEFMERNFTEDMTLEQYASYTGRSLATFKRDFAKVSAISPQRWILEHRLDLARHLIAEKGMAITEAAYHVGFKNRSHFSTAFKARFGYSPSGITQRIPRTCHQTQEFTSLSDHNILIQ